LNRCQKLIVEGNIVDVDESHPIRFRNYQFAQVARNRSSTGELIEGFDLNASVIIRDRVARTIQDALLLSI